MKTPSPAQLLDVWERGLQLNPTQRALLLLAAVFPEQSLAELAARSIGWRDRQLFNLRERVFGERIECFAKCPQCDAGLEFEISTSAVGAQHSAAGGEFSVSAAGYLVEFRLPNSEDLEAASRHGNNLEARTMILQRCITSAKRGKRAVKFERLPVNATAAVAARMAELDPEANVEIALTCASCGHEWLSSFDVVAFLWIELTTWAIRLLRDVHLLAAAYGWRENEILAMSPVRRNLYLQMIRA